MCMGDRNGTNKHTNPERKAARSAQIEQAVPAGESDVSGEKKEGRFRSNAENEVKMGEGKKGKE